jgi:putative transposase
MDFEMQEQIAAFRYGLIAPIVSRQSPMLPGELKHLLEEIASRTYTIPGSHRTTVSTRTLERYIANYRRAGWEGLKPKRRPATNRTSIPLSVLQAAIDLRKERPERSVEQIIFLLEQGSITAPGSIAPSTLARHLRKAGVSRQELLHNATPQKGRRRFEASDVHEIWQSDFQHTLYLPDPTHPGKRKKAILFAIMDDYSRLIVHAEFYWDEKLPRLEDSLKKAILRYGIPEQFYCDNGAAFSSHHLLRICGKLGIRLSHSRAFRPQGRGKIERFFRFIDTSFKPEAYNLIERGDIQGLAQLNNALTAWLDGYYHIRKHGGTGQTPLARATASKCTMKRVPISELTDIFLWEENRKVDKTGCVHVFGNIYEVPCELSGEKVKLRFDPFDLSVIQVWFDGKRFPDAIPLDLHRSVHKRVKTKPSESIQEIEPSPGEVNTGELSFFHLAEEKQREGWKSIPLTFAPKPDESRGDEDGN